MNKRIDGRTAKGLRLRAQARESLLNAYIDLIRGGVPAPTARQTGARAGLSLRALFNHFPDPRALRLASFNRVQALSGEFFAATFPPAPAPPSSSAISSRPIPGGWNSSLPFIAPPRWSRASTPTWRPR